MLLGSGIIAVLGLVLYLKSSDKLKTSIFGNQKVVNWIRPIRTGREGELLPSANLILPDSISHVNVASLATGRSIVLFYFLPDCPYCLAEMSEITRNISHLKAITFCLITPYPYVFMKQFYEKYNLGLYDNLVIGSEEIVSLGRYFNINRVPFIAVYNRNGRLVSAFAGNVSYEQILSESLK